jgi:hypothetical protein
LSFSAFHPELWQPAWGIRLILEALISFLPTPADGAVGALDWKKEERQRLAKLSQSYCCPTCGKCSRLLPELKEGGNDEKKPSTIRFAKEIAELQRLQQAADKTKKTPTGDTTTESQDETKESSVANNEAKEESTSDASSSRAAVIAPSSTSAEAINQEAPEEEIVFDFNSTPERSEEEPKEHSAATVSAASTNPAENAAMPDMSEPRVQAQNNNNNAMPVHDPSWMYDPILNLMMVLLAVICYLLIQKYQGLMEELYELQQMSNL